MIFQFLCGFEWVRLARRMRFADFSFNSFADSSGKGEVGNMPVGKILFQFLCGFEILLARRRTSRWFHLSIPLRIRVVAEHLKDLAWDLAFNSFADSRHTISCSSSSE